MVQSADSANQPIFPGWQSVYEWPSHVMVFVVEARRILSYYKNYTDEQRPPKSIWHSVKKCEAWIEDHNPFDKDKKGVSEAQLSFDDWETE